MGLTHASIVMPVVRSSEALSLTVTELFVPLNDRAPPNLPSALHVAPEVEPVLPVPDASAAVVPAPSLKPYAATMPGGAAAAWAAFRPRRAKAPSKACEYSESAQQRSSPERMGLPNTRHPVPGPRRYV